ncbi:MAG TPA: hypothetical protein VIY29_22115, partial [Ktedonobacteraceae bacterium]
LSGSGFQEVQTRPYALEYRGGTREGQVYIEDGIHVFRTLRPFIQKWGCLSKDFDALQQQTLEELHRPDFCATWHLLTAWGIRPKPEAQEPSS